MFWRVGIARNAVFFHSFVASKARKGSSEKRELRRIGCPRCLQNLHHACARERFGSRNRWNTVGSEHFWKLTSTKFAPRLRARPIWQWKSLKLEGFGGLLEVELRKNCTTPARESDSEVKIVKNWRSRDVFWGSKCVSRGRRRDLDTLQNTWQAQEFVRVAKTLAGVGDLKRVWNDAFRVAGARISCFAISMFEASDAETVEGLQISCDGSVTLQWSFRVVVTGLRMPRLNFFVAGAVLLKHPLENR